MTKNSTSCWNSYRVKYLFIVGAFGAFTACTPGERAAPGQPTMKEMMQRGAASTADHIAKYEAFNKRVQSLTTEEAEGLLSSLKKNPQDSDTYFLLLRYYEKKVDIRELNALKLWYIEHHPDGRLRPGNINPRHDRAAYQKGKALWLAHVKSKPESSEIRARAADFLGGGDKALAEKILLAARALRPNDDRWVSLLARHYAFVLHGAAEPYTEYNVFRVVSAAEAHDAYADDVRNRLAVSKDGGLLAATALAVLRSDRVRRPSEGNGVDGLALARLFTRRALSVDPESAVALRTERQLSRYETERRVRQLLSMPRAAHQNLAPDDKFLLAFGLMRSSWGRQKIDEAEIEARELLALAEQNRSHPLYSDAALEANMTLGKVAFRKGDRRNAVRHLLAAGEVPVTKGNLWIGLEMNLPRVLVDAGDRMAVAQFLEAVAPKVSGPNLYQDWASKIRKGINPDLMPTITAPGCKNDPC